MTTLTITEFTDPACPIAFSAEPHRRRLQWLYGDQLAWRVRVVVLASSPDDYLARGFTLDQHAAAYARLADAHGMPIDPTERARFAASEPACRAVVGARREHGDAVARRLLRALAVLQFRRNPLDEPATVRAAAEAVDLDPDRAVEWTTDPDVARETAADATAARTPPPEALAQPERLSAWDGGLRYSCPSYEIVREADGARLIAPGWQETRTYEMAIANLAPRLERREDADDPLAVLTWAGEPLATREVAAVMGVEPETARERLGAAGAHFAPVAADGYWTAP